jgi:signal transduction histidine kinase/CheY-like chemotaxis protein
LKGLQYLLIAFFFFIVPATGIADPAGIITAKKGLLDLRNADFNKHDIALNGEWGFYWNQLLAPSSIKNNGSYVEFPQLWNNTYIKGKQLSAKGYATYTLSVLLPGEHEQLALKLPDVYTSYKLYVNDSLFAANGKPGTSAETTEPYWSNITVQLPGNTDTLKLVLQIANFSHSKGGPYKAIYIGDQDNLFLKQNKTSSADFLLTGCLFMGGLFFFGLYLFGKHDKAILYFSLFCITYSYRIVGADPYSLHTFLPGIPWWITIHAEYLSLYFSIIFFTLYIRYLYPHDTHKKIIQAMVGICLSFIAATVCCPPSAFTMLINPFLVIVFLYIAYALYVYIKAAKNKRTGAIYSLIGTGVMLTVFVIINLHYFSILGSFEIIVFIGYTIFFFLQSLILSFRFAHSLKHAKLQAEQGLKAKSQFLSTMSHEIRTPLNSVIGIAHLLLKSNPRNDQKEQMEILLFSANNLLSIVNDILDFNKIEAGKINFEKIETDLSALGKNIIGGFKTYAKEKGIALDYEVDDKLDVRVFADPMKTSQVITNLVHNAIKFTNRGSVSLIFSVDNKTKESITVTFSVKDSGIGIDPAKQKMIFERFTQADSSTSRSFGGTGLGLSICKSILEKQGSKLQLSSKPGQGSVFYFTQTFEVGNKIEKKKEELKPVEKTNEAPLQGVNILLVEDNELNILVATKFLEKWGAGIEVARNGLEAIERFDETKHQLILMDLHMPVLDGEEATIRLRQQGAKVPIIALTASILSEDNKRIRASGVSDVIMKPFEPAAFLSTLMRSIEVFYSSRMAS